jgi:hypothetical protein
MKTKIPSELKAYIERPYTAPSYEWDLRGDHKPEEVWLMTSESGLPGCENCKGMGHLFAFIVMSGPHPQKSMPGRVTGKYIDTKGWYYGHTLSFPCPVCNEYESAWDHTMKQEEYVT